MTNLDTLKSRDRFYFLGLKNHCGWSLQPWNEKTLAPWRKAMTNLSSVVSDSVTPWIAARQASLAITNSQSLLKLMPIKLVMPSSHLVFCHPLLLLLPILPASGSFPMSQLFTSGGQSTGVSFSVSPSNEHPGLISFRMDWLDLLAVQGTLKSLFQHQTSKASILALSFLHSPITSIHDHWKNHSLD